MNYEVDTMRIKTEYARRARAIAQDRYSLLEPANLLMHHEVASGCVRALRRAAFFPFDRVRVADIGCGMGAWLLEFVQWGADPDRLAGIDLMPDRIAQARHRLPGADLHVGSAAELPWPDESFDLVSQMLVFENIFDPALERAVAREMLRILKPGGGILWFDLRVGNPRNPEVRGISKAQIRALFPGCDADIRRVLLAPPLSRLIAPRSWLAAELLSVFPFLRTHYVGVIRKPV